MESESLLLLEVGWPLACRMTINVDNSNLEILLNDRDVTKSGGLIMQNYTYWLGSIQLMVDWRNPPRLLNLTFILDPSN